MVKRYAPIALQIGLGLIIAYLVIARGAYYRLYWFPAWIALALLFSAWLILRVQGVLEPAPHPVAATVPLILLVGLSLASLRGSINPEESVFGLLRLAALGMIFAMATNLFRKPRSFLGVYVFIAGLGFAEAAYGLVQYAARDFIFRLPGLPYRPPRWAVFGTFQDYNNFAGLMELSLFPALALLGLPERSDEETAANALARWAMKALPAAMMAGALALSLSRAGWIATAAGLAVFAALTMPWRRMTPAAWVLLSVVIVAGALATVSLLDYGPLRARGRTVADAISGKDTQPIQSRVLAWKISLAMIEDHPLLGAGIGTYTSAFPAHRLPEAQSAGTLAHNDFLHVAAETGIPAAIAWALWIAAGWIIGLRAFWRTRSPLLAASLAAIAAVMAHSLVATHFQIPGLAALLVLQLALVAGGPREEESE